MPDWLDLENQLFRRLLFSLSVILVLFILVRLTRRLANRIIEEPERLYRVNKLVGRLGGIVGVLLVIVTLSIERSEVVTVLSVAGAGLAIAMRETLLGIAGWMYIAFRAPYNYGDRIEVNNIRGDVIDVRLLHTIVMEIGGWVEADQSTGRLVHIPNSEIFLSGVYNYTRGFHFIWNELALTVSFRSDWSAAREIMLTLAEESAAIVEQQARSEIRQMAREYLVYYNILSPFVYVRIVENGVLLTLRYLCEVRKRRGTEHALTMGILNAFAEHDQIELAYPMMGVSELTPPQFGPIPKG